MTDTEATLANRFSSTGYILDASLSTTLELMQSLQRPLLIEGEAGVGKTEAAKALAQVTGGELIRLQCYDGLDANAAVYEWNYTKQLISIKLHESAEQPAQLDVFSEAFLMPRPLLQAIRRSKPPVLLIDEIDRADEAFEAYLLELLSDFQITIPELGTVRAQSRPLVVLTSNGTRELSDALRRRCLYHFMDYPDKEKELSIILSRLPGIDQRLGQQVVDFIQQLRLLELQKRPGVAETLDWAAALMGLGVDELTQNVDVIIRSRSCFLKTRDDVSEVNADVVEDVLRKIA